MIDVQKQEPLIQIPINKVGIDGIKYPVLVRQRDGGWQGTTGVFTCSVSLASNQRGTHMSRFVACLNEFASGEPFSLDNVSRLNRRMLEILPESEKCFISVNFIFFIDKFSPVTNHKGKLDYDCTISVAMTDEGDISKELKVCVPITSLCPCSKEISEYGAHNQRGNVVVKVAVDEMLWLEDLIQKIEKCGSCEIYPFLKRKDEKYVTERAYDNPKFVEDIVRQVAVRLDDYTDYSIEVFNFESIHNHSAYAAIYQGEYNADFKKGT